MMSCRCHFLIKDVFDVVGANGVMNQSFFDRVDDRDGAIAWIPTVPLNVNIN